MVKEILLKKRPWSDLFEPAFFFTYRHYVVVIVTGEEKRPFMECCGLVESRLRILVSSAENNRYVKLAHVNCHSYGKGPLDGDVPFVKKWFIGMEFDRNPTSATSINHANPATANSGNSTDPTAPPAKLNIDLSDVINSFELAIDRGMSSEAANTSVTVKYAKRSHLSQFLSAKDMDDIKKQSAAYTAANHGLQRHGSNLSQLSSNSPRSCDSPSPAVPSPQVANSVITSTSPSNINSKGKSEQVSGLFP